MGLTHDNVTSQDARTQGGDILHCLPTAGMSVPDMNRAEQVPPERGPEQG